MENKTEWIPAATWAREVAENQQSTEDVNRSENEKKRLKEEIWNLENEMKALAKEGASPVKNKEYLRLIKRLERAWSESDENMRRELEEFSLWLTPIINEIESKQGQTNSKIENARVELAEMRTQMENDKRRRNGQKQAAEGHLTELRRQLASLLDLNPQLFEREKWEEIQECLHGAENAFNGKRFEAAEGISVIALIETRQLNRILEKDNQRYKELVDSAESLLSKFDPLEERYSEMNEWTWGDFRDWITQCNDVSTRYQSDKKNMSLSSLEVDVNDLENLGIELREWESFVELEKQLWAGVQSTAEEMMSILSPFHGLTLMPGHGCEVGDHTRDYMIHYMEGLSIRIFTARNSAANNIQYIVYENDDAAGGGRMVERLIQEESTIKADHVREGERQNAKETVSQKLREIVSRQQREEDNEFMFRL